jgi:glutaredoxin
LSYRFSFETDMADNDILIYTRTGCHLCDDAKALLERYGLAPRLINIDADAALKQKYNDCVPVVWIDGKERFRGRIDEVLLRRLLANRKA